MTSRVCVQAVRDESQPEPRVHGHVPHRHLLHGHVPRSHGDAGPAQLAPAAGDETGEPVPRRALPVGRVRARRVAADDDQSQRHHHRRHRRHRVRHVQRHDVRVASALVAATGASVVLWGAVAQWCAH